MGYAIDSMADQLAREPQPQPLAPGESRTARMRCQGGATARELSMAVGLSNSGLVGGLLKHDIQLGRISFSEGRYWWNFGHEDAPRPPRPGALCETLEWHEVANDDFPDAHLTVLGRLRNNEEPVWLVFFDGEQWLDIDAQPVEVVRWADMPKGGEV